MMAAQPMMNNGMMGDDENQYMEQEEEWEREGLLDPAWEKQQKKVIITYIMDQLIDIDRFLEV
jgi:hypothetical protein